MTILRLKLTRETALRAEQSCAGGMDGNLDFCFVERDGAAGEGGPQERSAGA